MNSDKEDTVLIQEREYNLQFFRCPSLLIQIPIFITITLLLFILTLPFSYNGLLKSISFFLIPGLITIFILPYMKGYQEEINFRQSSLMALLTLSIVAILILFYINFGTEIRTALVVAYGVTLSFRFLIIRSAFISDVFKSLPHTFLNSIIALPLIHLFLPLSILDIVLFLLVSFISLATVEAFIAVVNRPFLSNFDTSTLDMIRISFQLFIGKEKGQKELEDVFKINSLKADIKYTFFTFKTDNKNKALFVIPKLHPGPLKGIAGSNLPEILSRELKNFGEVFTFHGPSTHMLNPIRKEDCSRLSKEIKKDHSKLNYFKTGTNFIGEDSGVFIGTQIFGEGLFMTASFSPRPTEDIDASIGEIITLKAQDSGYDKLGFVDAHNCVKKGCSEIYYPSRRYQSIIDKSTDMMEKIKALNKGKLNLGISTKRNYTKSKGIAGEGIKVAVFEINNKKNAYILIDGNNMVRGLRENIQEEIADLVDNSEVTTTDSHEVNTLNKDYNPVGLEMDENDIIEDVRELTENAIKDVEPVKVASDTGEIRNLSIMGPINSNRMNAVAETIYKMAPITAILAFSVQALSTLLIVLLM